MRMIKNIGWQSLQERPAISRLILIYKIDHGLTDASFTRLLSTEGPTRRMNSDCDCVASVKQALESTFFFFFFFLLNATVDIYCLCPHRFRGYVYDTIFECACMFVCMSVQIEKSKMGSLTMNPSDGHGVK